MRQPTTSQPRHRARVTADATGSRQLSMHEGIAPWCDCCTCEAEPYWVAVAEELGIDLRSDYEDGRVR